MEALVKSSRLDAGVLTLSPALHPIQPPAGGRGRSGCGRSRGKGDLSHRPALYRFRPL
ncbi:MAG: hypothetical protein ACLT3D_08525 [Lawsonibacter sp.]